MRCGLHFRLLRWRTCRWGVCQPSPAGHQSPHPHGLRSIDGAGGQRGWGSCDGPQLALNLVGGGLIFVVVGSDGVRHSGAISTQVHVGLYRTELAIAVLSAAYTVPADLEHL